MGRGTVHYEPSSDDDFIDVDSEIDSDENESIEGFDMGAESDESNDFIEGLGSEPESDCESDASDEPETSAPGYDPTSDFEVASMNDEFVEALHTDVAKLYAYDFPWPTYKAIMSEFGSLWFTEKFEMRIPANLHSTLQSDQPPSFDYFLNTPSAIEMKKKKLLSKWYIVYGAALRHQEILSEKKLCIGSASSKDGGAQPRIGQWILGTNLPEKVIVCKKNGFEVVHIGVLLMIKKPSLKYHALGRLWTLTMEARLSFRFWSVYQKEREEQTGNHYAEKLHTWNINKLEWKGLNTHTPLRDPVDNAGACLSLEGIEALEKELIQIAEQQRIKTYALTAKWMKTPRGKARLKAYRQTPKAKATAKRWNQTPKAKARAKKWNQTPKAKARTKKWQATPKGQVARKKAQAKRKIKQHNLSPEEYVEHRAKSNKNMAKYLATPKGVVSVEGARVAKKEKKAAAWAARESALLKYM